MTWQHKGRSILVTGILAVPLFIVGCAPPTATNAGGSDQEFINAAEVDLSGLWRRQSPARIESRESKVINSDALSEFTVTSLGSGFYEYKYTVTVADDAEPITHNGVLTRSFESTWRMVVAPDGSLKGINLQDPAVSNYWLVDENTMEYVYQEPGAKGYLLKGRLTRVPQ